MFRSREFKKKFVLLIVIFVVSLLKYFGLIFPNLSVYDSILWPDEREYRTVSYCL